MSTHQALIVIDVQNGFLDPEQRWGQSSNPDAENRVRAIALAWQEAQAVPIVLVRHDSESATSPLRPGQPGNNFMPQLDGVAADLLVTKHVNSAFYGSPDLHGWLQQHQISNLVICGIQTNMCVETTARMAGNLGYTVTVPLDATRTFDIATTLGDGTEIAVSADDLMRATAASLHGGGFATVTDTASVLQALTADSASSFDFETGRRD